jgi:hypothetical protein
VLLLRLLLLMMMRLRTVAIMSIAWLNRLVIIIVHFVFFVIAVERLVIVVLVFVLFLFFVVVIVVAFFLFILAFDEMFVHAHMLAISFIRIGNVIVQSVHLVFILELVELCTSTLMLLLLLLMQLLLVGVTLAHLVMITIAHVGRVILIVRIAQEQLVQVTNRFRNRGCSRLAIRVEW